MDPIMSQVVIIVGFLMFMYFMMIRPNKKRQQQVQEMRNGVKVGDEIITIGGVKGTICSVNDTEVIIETSEDRNKIVFVKSAIHTVVVKDDEVEEIEEDEETEEEISE